MAFLASLHARIIATLGLLALSWSFTANAAVSDCRQSGTPGVPGTTSMSGLEIPRDLPVGFAIPGSKVAISWSISCAATGVTGGRHWALTPNGAFKAEAVAGLSNVYKVTSGTTNVEGVGFRILDASGTPVSFTALTEYVNSVDMGDAPKGQTSFQWGGYLELVKISNTVASGTGSLILMATVPGQVFGNESDAKSRWTYSYTISKPAATTCIATNPTQTVVLPVVSVATASLNENGGGQRSGYTPFAINLNCSSGGNLYMTFTDANNPTATYGVLSPAGTTSGKEYGVGLLYADPAKGLVRVTFGPDSPAAGTTGQFAVGSTPDGILSLNFIAAYAHYPGVQFPVGAINAKATFTLSYQ